MTTSTAASLPTGARPRPRATPVGPVTQLKLIRSEWTKLWSLRSTRWSLFVAFLAQAGLPLLVAAVQMSRWGQMSPFDRAEFNSIDTATRGFSLSQLAVGVLGVLIISGEYSTGMIRSSLMAAPKRVPVLWAKLIVFALVTFALMLVASFIAFFGVQAIVSGHHLQHSIGASGALRAVFGVTLYLTVLGVLCTGFGTLLRNTAGGIAAFVLLLFVLPGILHILPQSVEHAVNRYLPSTVGTELSQVTGNGGLLPPWAGMALFAGYTAVIAAGAAVGLRRRDA